MSPAVAAVAAMLEFAVPKMGPNTRARTAEAIDDAVGRYEADGRVAPTREVVVAVIWRESLGNHRACAPERGGSSRGLMQLYRPGTSCKDPDDERRLGWMYDVRRNVFAGVAVLVDCLRIEVDHGCRHSFLDHYRGHATRSGRPSEYARAILAMVGGIWARFPEEGS